MRKLGLLPLVLLGACTDPYLSGTGLAAGTIAGAAVFDEMLATPRPWLARPEVPPAMPPAPVHVMRETPSFTFEDHSTGRVYRIWEYEDETTVLPLVTVQEPGDVPRLAAWDEINFAFGYHDRFYAHQDFDHRLRYLSGEQERRWAVPAQVLDDKIYRKAEVVKQLEAAALELEAHIRACASTKVQTETIPPTAMALQNLYDELARRRTQLKILVDTKRALYAPDYPGLQAGWMNP